jgi:hypothetical protein
VKFVATKRYDNFFLPLSFIAFGSEIRDKIPGSATLNSSKASYFTPLLNLMELGWKNLKNPEKQ